MAYPAGDSNPPPPDLVVARPGRFRTLGPLVALLLPVCLMLVAVLVLALWPCSGRECVEPSLGAWGIMLLAVPTALAVGIPWYLNAITVTLALTTSAGLWMVLGAIAGRRTARDLDAGWGTLAGEIITISAGVFAGVLLGFAIIALYLRF